VTLPAYPVQIGQALDKCLGPFLGALALGTEIIETEALDSLDDGCLAALIAWLIGQLSNTTKEKALYLVSRWD
jgi:hypothetical protein